LVTYALGVTDDDRVFKALADPTRRVASGSTGSSRVTAARSPELDRLIHDRWIDKYTERHVSALTTLKSELEGSA
jgi:hypothetical protein